MQDQEKRDDREVVISVEGMTARLEGNTILEGITFKVFRGEILFIVGRSGSGKTVLMKHMIGQFRPAEGRVLINGVDVHGAEESDWAAVRRRIGVLFQAGGLLGSMTLGDNMALPLEKRSNLPDSLKKSIIRMKLGMVGLADTEHLLPAELSGGMKKRAGLARAMVMDPEILFFDEPSAGLDPVTSVGLDDTIADINQGMGTTMVIVSHELPSIFKIGHRMIMLDGQQKGIIADGDPRFLQGESRDERVVNFLNRRNA